MNETIRLKNVSFFRNSQPVLKEINLQMKGGELIGLIGPNGAGKSTLLKLMMKLWKPTEGSIILSQERLEVWTQKMLARQVAYLPQNPVFESAFSCKEVVMMGRYAHLDRFERESTGDENIVREAMAQTETTHLGDRLITELSGGERQRVLMARTLAQGAQLILLDEPTANLDPHYQLDLLNLIESLVEKGFTVMMAIHDLGLAARYANRLVLLHQGRIVADGNPETVLTPAHLRSVYGIEAEVSRHPKTGRLFVFPIKLEAKLKS
ncbi:MAG: heme ABC transporter ATP-binding protein [Nitrospiria bacterium]